MSTITWTLVLVAIMIGAGTLGWTLGVMFPSKISSNVVPEININYTQATSGAKNTVSTSNNPDTKSENNPKPSFSYSSSTHGVSANQSGNNAKPSFSYSSSTHTAVTNQSENNPKPSFSYSSATH